MAKYKGQYGYPKADISAYGYSNVVHILPPKEDGPTDENGKPVHTHDYALSGDTILEHSDTIQDERLRKEVEIAGTAGEYGHLPEDLLKRVGEHFAHDVEAVPCNTCGKLIWVDEWAGMYARNKCNVCNGKCSNCGADRDEHEVLISSSNRTRVPNKYKCEKCGHIREGIITG